MKLFIIMLLVSLFSYLLGLRIMLSNVEKTLLNLINSYLDDEKTNDDKLKRLTLEALYYCIFKKDVPKNKPPI